ncbi:MAG: metallophosphoesterase [Candidatus Heimdallarchaeota archaeon]|nr:MAG: metallophosphoesterase [Candidatus Heimdallarchaeota archaeon]
MKNRMFFLLILVIILIPSLFTISIGRNYRKKQILSLSSKWHFIALGDSRQQFGTWDDDNNKYTHDNTNNPTRAALFTSIAENNPEIEFILHTGDMVMSGGEQDDWNRYFEDIENMTKENITIYYAVGNHEKYTYALGDSQWGPSDEDFSTYLANVELPGNERYYSFDFMNQIHFVFINTEEDWSDGFSITTDQNNWLINDFETNTLDFIIAVFHRPCYSIRDSGRVHAAQQVRNVLEPLFLQYGVDLVFSGHDHYYYRAVRKGVTYITTGGAGADLYTNKDTSEWQDGDVYFSEYHYCNITVTQSNENIVTKVDVLILDEGEGTTTLGDSFEVTDHLKETTSSSLSDTEKTIPSTDFSFLLTIIGVICIMKKRKK